MKRNICNLLLLFSLAGFGFSCSKSNDSPGKANDSYVLKFKMDGIQKEMKFSNTAIFTSPSAVFSAGLYGVFEENKSNGLTIIIYDSETLKTNKTYSADLINVQGMGSLPGVNFNLTDQDGVQYFSSGLTTGTSMNLQFSEISPDRVRGTFSGTAMKVRSSPIVYATITEGEFNLKRTF